MATVAELRDTYPDLFKDKSDTDMVTMLAREMGAPLDYVAYELGLDPAGYIQNEGFGDDVASTFGIGMAGAGQAIAGIGNVLAAPFTDEKYFQTPGLDDYIQRQRMMLSPGKQESQAEVDQAWDSGNPLDIAWAYASNPLDQVLLPVVESAPSMLGGGVLGGMGRGAAALGARWLGGANAATRGLSRVAPYAGEGGMMTGSAYEQMTDAGVDPQDAALYSLGVGAVGGGIAGGAGALATKYGLTDPTRALAGVRLPAEAPPLPWGKRFGYGAALEAGQEALQSPMEQMAQNYATGTDLLQDTGRAMVEGALTGGLLGAGFNAIPRRRDQAPPELSETDMLRERVNPGESLSPNLIDTQLGIRPLADTQGLRSRADDIAAAFNEPSGVFVTDPTTGLERELSMGDRYEQLATGQVAPTAGPVKVTTAPKAKPDTPTAKAVPPTPVAPTYSELEQQIIAAAPANKFKKQTGEPWLPVVTLAQKLSAMSLEDLQTAQSNPGIPGWQVPMYQVALAAKTTEQVKTAQQQAAQNAAVDTAAGPTSAPVDAETSQNPDNKGGTAAKANVVKDLAPNLSKITNEITNNLYQKLFDTLQNANNAFTRKKNPILAWAKPFYDAGQIKSPQDLQALMNERYGKPSTPASTPNPPETPSAIPGQTTPQTSQTPSPAPGAVPTALVVAEAPAAPKVRSPETQNVLNAATSGAALEPWELEETLRELVPEVLSTELAGQVDRWVAKLKPLSKGDQKSATKVAAYNAAVAERASRLAQLRNAVTEMMVKRRGLGEYTGANTSFDQLAADFVRYDEAGRPVLGADGKPVPLADLRSNNQTGAWTHQTIKDIDQAVQRALEARGVNFKTVDLGAPLDETPSGQERDTDILDAQVNNGVITNNAAQSQTTDEEAGEVAPTLGLDPWAGEFEASGKESKFSDIGGANTGAGRVTGNALKVWAKLAGYAVDADPSVARDQALADVKALPPNARALWNDIISEYDKPSGNEALDVKRKQNIRDVFDNIRDVGLQGPKIGRINAGRIDTKGKLVEAQYAALSRQVPDAIPYSELSPAERSLVAEAFSISIVDTERESLRRKFVQELANEHRNLLRAGESAVATGDATARAGSPAVSGQESAGVRQEAGGEPAGVDQPVGGEAPEPDIVIGNKPALAEGRIVTKPKRRRVAAPESQVQQGVDAGEDVQAKNPTTVEKIRQAVTRLLGKGENWRLHLYQTLDEATAAGHTPRKIGKAYGWVEADAKGIRHAYLIADRIEQGTELGKFLHEVGAHIGIENILSKADIQNLYGKIKEWALQTDISRESQIAMEAFARVERAQQDRERTGREEDQYTPDDVIHETIAYFVEVAVNDFDVDPTAMKADSPFGTWFVRLWTAFQRALRKVRLENIDSLEPQHVVDLAFGAAHLEMAAAKPETSDTSPGKVRYGIAGPVTQPSHVKNISSAISQALEDAPTQTALAKLLGWMTVDQMAERFGGAVPVIRDIAKTLSNISAKNKHWMNRADHIIRMWEGLSKKQSELLGPLMGQARIAEFDPDKDTPTKPEHHQVLAQWRQLQHLDKTAKVKAVNVYRAVRKHFEDDLLESEAYLQQLKTQAKATNDRTLDSLLKTLQSLRKRTKGPYFPLRRRGDHYVVAMSPAMRQLHERRAAAKDGAGLSATDEKLYWQMRKDPKHYVNQGVEGEWGAKRLARKFQQSGMSTQVNKGRFRSEVMRASLGKDMESFDQMLAEIKLDDKAKEKLRDAYEDLLIESLPENHPLKSQLAAEGIAGWDNDMRRVFAKTSQSRAFALSRLLHQRTLQEQLAQLETASRAFGPNADLARTLHNELGQHMELAYTRSEDPTWVRLATGFNYMSMLGFSPAFWFINLMQVPTITAPWLAARNNGNWSDTLRGLAKASGQAAKLIKWSVDKEWRAELDMSKAVGLTADEKQLLLDMQDSGKLQFTITQDLGQVAEGRNDVMARLIRTLNAPTHATELINRTSTALAAYRVSQKNNAGLTQNQGESDAAFKQRVHDAAVEFAIRATDTTQVNMDPSATARNMQRDPFLKSHNLARIMFQFWKFQQGMAYLSISTMKDAINHPDPEIRKQARATALGMSAMLVSTAGAFGLPFVGVGLSLASLLMGLDGDDDEDDDLERDLKNVLHDYLPEPIAKYLTKGIWGVLDGPDLSARFSMGNLMNPLAYARYDDSRRGEDVVKETIMRVFGGATLANASGVYDGLQALQDGDFSKAMEKILPLKFARDLAKAYSLNAEGLTTGKGEARLDPNDFSVVDPIWQAMGVQPMKKSRYYDQQASIQGPKQAVDTTRQKLLAAYGQARVRGEDVSEIMRDIVRFNQRNPHAKINQEHRQQATERRRQNKRDTLDNGILANKQTRPYVQYGRWAQ